MGRRLRGQRSGIVVAVAWLCGCSASGLPPEAMSDMMRAATSDMIAPAPDLPSTNASFKALPIEDGLFDTGIAAGDFDGDGVTDLVGGNSSASNGSLEVAHGNGDGTFTRSGTAYPLGARNAQPVIAADLDGDGRLDVVALAQFPASVTVAFGDGRGGFTHDVTVAVAGFSGSSYGPAFAVDEDHDGLLDLVFEADDVVHPMQSGVYVALNLGGGNFAPAVLGVMTTGAGALNTMGDWNGDGLADVIVESRDASGVYSLTQYFADGSGGFQLAGQYRTPNGGVTLPYAADFDSDGFADVAFDGYAVQTWRSDRGTLVPTAKTAFTTPVDALLTADFDGDGHVDLFGFSYGSGWAGVAHSNGDCSLAAPTSFRVDGMAEGPGLVADFNRDGRPDVAFWMPGQVEILLNTSM